MFYSLLQRWSFQTLGWKIITILFFAGTFSFFFRTVTMWDCRKTIKAGSHLSQYKAVKSVSTGFFSPHTGNKFLLTSQDDYLRCGNPLTKICSCSCRNFELIFTWLGTWSQWMFCTIQSPHLVITDHGYCWSLCRIAKDYLQYKFLSLNWQFWTSL